MTTTDTPPEAPPGAVALRVTDSGVIEAHHPEGGYYVVGLVGHVGVPESRRRLCQAAQPHAGLELVGLLDIVARYGIARQTAYTWADRPDFPAPAAVVNTSTKVWRLAEVDAWADSHGKARP